jgi:hypothetical protein
MKSLKTFTKNKKAVSSLFIGIYIALLSLLLISTLFVGTFISRSGIIEYLKVEQERMQESIQLYKLTTDITDVQFTSLQVINTGAIPVRLKALYIDHKLICDPSDPSMLGEEAYIEPKGNVSIPLFPNVPLDTTSLNAQWTVTTERGTKSTEKGVDLWGRSSGSIYTPNKFYFGPLMIYFDMFYWKSGNGPWRSGWSIPKDTVDVTWRIFLTNVDNRTITITDASSFLLVGNDNEPNSYLAWYIDPANSNMTLVPGKLSSICYSWSKPYSDNGKSLIKITKFQVGITCKNFLTFSGHFTAQNGTETPFGQTIPFEAVLITGENMASSITLTANPVYIRNDRTSYSTITATVRDSRGNPVVDSWVELYTTKGTLSENSIKTDANGQAKINLTSTSQQTTANVMAMCEGVAGTCQVNFTPAARIQATAIPATIPMNRNSTITLQLRDQNNQNVSQSGINMTVTLGWSGPKAPTLTYNGQTLNPPFTVTTDSNGRAIILLIAKDRAGTATITASPESGITSGNCTVSIT